MSSELSFDGKKYVSSRRLAEETGYTHDHLSRLCREKKIDGKLIGRIWFVNPESFTAYQNSFTEKHLFAAEAATPQIPEPSSPDDITIKKEFLPQEHQGVEHAATSFAQSTPPIKIQIHGHPAEDAWDSLLFSETGQPPTHEQPVQEKRMPFERHSYARDERPIIPKTSWLDDIQKNITLLLPAPHNRPVFAGFLIATLMISSTVFAFYATPFGNDISKKINHVAQTTFETAVTAADTGGARVQGFLSSISSRMEASANTFGEISSYIGTVPQTLTKQIGKRFSAFTSRATSAFEGVRTAASDAPFEDATAAAQTVWQSVSSLPRQTRDGVHSTLAFLVDTINEMASTVASLATGAPRTIGVLASPTGFAALGDLPADFAQTIYRAANTLTDRATDFVTGFFGGGAKTPAETVVSAPVRRITDEDIAKEKERLLTGAAEKKEIAADELPPSSPSVPATASELTRLRRELDALRAQGLATESAVQPKVVERVIERVIPGVAKETLDDQLNVLANSLRQEIYRVRDTGTAATQAVSRVVALTNRIDQLSDVTITKLTVSGVSGLTDSDVPNDITLSNYLPLTGGSLSSDLTVRGNFIVDGTQTFSGALSLTSFSATSTTAASVIDYRLGIGTSSPGTPLGVTGAGVFTGPLTALYFSATSTTATSTFAGPMAANVVPGAPHSFGAWATGVADSNPLVASFIVNPASAGTDTNLISASVGGSVRFLVDAEGDVFANSLTSVGGETLSTSTISTLTVENNSTLGDATTTDRTYFNSRIGSSLFPSANNSLDLGDTTNGLAWRTGIFGTSFGVGTTSPWGVLSVESTGAANNQTPIFVVGDQGTTTPFLYVSGVQGNIGIGTTSPAEQLSVANRLFVGGTGTSTIENNLFVGGALRIGGSSLYLDTDSIETLSSDFTLQSPAANNLIFQSLGGNVGIGTTSPGQKLSAAGDILGHTIIGSYFSATSTTATSTLAGFLNVTGTNSTSTFSGGLAANTFSVTGSATSTFGGGLNLLGGNINLATNGAFLINDVQTLSATTLGANVINSSLTSVGTLASLSVSGLSSFIQASTTQLSIYDKLFVGDTATTTISFSGGNIGVGTTTPKVLLHVRKSDPGSIVYRAGMVGLFESNGNTEFGIYSPDANAGQLIFGGPTGPAEGRVIYYNASHATLPEHMEFYTSGSLAMTIDGSQNVGIGSTTPGAKLGVTNTGSLPSFLVEDDTSPDQTPFIIDNAGNVGIGDTSPASRLEVRRDGTETGAVDFTGVASFISNYDTTAATNNFAALGFRLADTSGNERNAGGIFVRKEQEWTTTGSTRDSAMVFAAALNATAGEKMRITSDGNLLVGTTTTQAFNSPYVMVAGDVGIGRTLQMIDRGGSTS
ncbi:MAG: hypothetical protein HYS74_01895 [Parcubacteria group bacterium]|nr:hypothetical protein [Parcubacteria group bacterium]